MAISLNTVTVIGGLTKDMEVRYTNNNVAIGNFTVGFTTFSKGANEKNEKSNYIDVSLFGKQAENLKPYLGKGAKVAISGHIEQQTWEYNNQKNSKIVIIADSVQLLSSNNQNHNNSQPQYQQNMAQPQYQNQNYSQQYQQSQQFQPAPQPQYQQNMAQGLDNFPDEVLF